ncbi:uncharacterized protein LOC121855102 [Homarus americanus]|uniref:uncharacterized protein LOC121855102 n=1 Tax=Homarus americanus TaxID=6706 RepID=UPI001C46AD1B|nr:uncharacterized protein LOC121855102 [Homarus americanus]
MHRELIYLAAHLYFAINNTDHTNTFCSHETSQFSLHLRRLTGMLENLLCRLTVMINNREQLTPVLEEVTTLHLLHEASCGGRRLWMCILISRTRRALVMMRGVLQNGHNNSPINNDINVVTTQRKRFSRRRGVSSPRQGSHLGYLRRRTSTAFLVALQHYLTHEYPSDPRPSSYIRGASRYTTIHGFSNASNSSPNNLDGSSNTPGYFSPPEAYNDLSLYRNPRFYNPLDYVNTSSGIPSKHNSSGLSNINNVFSSMVSPNNLDYTKTVYPSDVHLPPDTDISLHSYSDVHSALTAPDYLTLRGYFYNQFRSKTQDYSSDTPSYYSNTPLKYSNSLNPVSRNPTTYSNIPIYSSVSEYYDTPSQSINPRI